MISRMQWLIRFIEENTKRIKLEIVKNRSLDVFKNVFECLIKGKTLVITGGHKSYPGAVPLLTANILLSTIPGFKTLKDLQLITLKIYGR